MGNLEGMRYAQYGGLRLQVKIVELTCTKCIFGHAREAAALP